MIDFDHPRDIALVLAPLAETMTTLVAPGPVMTPTGISWALTDRKTVAVLNSKETSDAIIDLKRVTNFARMDLKNSANPRGASINSFAVSPDGHKIIFSLTERDR